jgi:hypothetical protein
MNMTTSKTQPIRRPPPSPRISPTARAVSALSLLIAAACSSNGGTSSDETNPDPSPSAQSTADAGPTGAGGSGGSVGTAPTGGGGGATVEAAGGGGGATVEPTPAAPCPVTRDVRVALWFPKDPGAVQVAADLEQADHVVSVTVLTDADSPTADELLTDYDAIVVGSDWGFGALSADDVGDLLADYVDGGGVVVDTMFDHTTWADMGTQEALGGRWQTDGYNPVTLATQVNAPLDSLTLTLTDASNPLVQTLDPDAFVADLNPMDFVYMTEGAVNADSPLGFVELARWSSADQEHPAIVASTDADHRVLGLMLSPVLNFQSSNEDGTTRNFLACSISQLVP